MPLTVVIRVALRALGRNVLRTALTMLGIVIGVAAVMAMVALGHGAQATVETELRSTGANLVFVTAGNYIRGGDTVNIPSGRGAATTLTVDDANAIAAIPGVAARAAGVSERGFVAVTGTNASDLRRGGRLQPAQDAAAAQARRFFGRIQGTDASFPSIYDWAFQGGAFFTEEDVANGRELAVLGRKAAAAIFGTRDPVGAAIEVRGHTFTVVGVTASEAEDQADTVFVPYTALQRLLGISHLHTVTVAARESGQASAVAAAITRLLRDRHGLPTSGGLYAGGPGGAGAIPDDFVVRTQAAQALTKGLYTSVAAFALANMPKLDEVTLDEMAGTLSRANATMTALLAGIAAISLIVGGIGIMNIMLVAVTERTQEIGLRRAVGARARDVLVQFLVEAVALSVISGLAGIALGFLTSAGIERLLEWPARVSVDAVAIAFATAIAVGVFFGFYPARKASRLEPIDALRYE